MNTLMQDLRAEINVKIDLLFKKNSLFCSKLYWQLIDEYG